MSFIMQRYKCLQCSHEFNVALGTFGYGMPEKCPRCGGGPFELIGHKWKSEETTSL